MISDVLFDAHDQLREYLARYPDVYELRDRIEKLCVEMDSIRRALDAPPTTTAVIVATHSHRKGKDNKWRTIGEVCVDSGHLIICDPCQAEEASSQWIETDLDLNECAKKGIRTWELTNDHDCPIAAVTETGLGDGRYKVEARYEDLGEWGKRVAEIRIRFLLHPQLGSADE